MATLLLTKSSLSGAMIFQQEYPDIESIAKALKISKKNADLIYSGHRFPPGKTRVLNKYTIRVKPVPPENPIEVSFS
jgi:hypothetical protein